MASLHLAQLYRLQGLAENSCGETRSMGFISVAGKAGLSCAFLLGAGAAQAGEGSGLGKAAATGQLPAGHAARGTVPKHPRTRVGGCLPGGHTTCCPGLGRMPSAPVLWRAR